ncbi:dephospho-CoA kinase [Candidatus Woesearchaeota archaeon]|nr:dephospho-CoA kinase [Candidatus Woesearchaeota archaeon]
MKLGITGIFGSGKTEVANMFARCGYKVVSVDKVGHKLLDKKEIKKKIIREFGDVLTKNKVDRRKLKDIVFYDSKKLKKLNKIIHPYLIKEVKKLIKGKAVVDAALLIELGLHKHLDKVIVVKINKNNAVKRILKKKKYTKKEIENIIKSQLTQNKKLRYADFIINNNKSLDNTKKQVIDINKSL